MRTLFLTLITCLFVSPAIAKYSGGTGEPNDPYQIATAADLIALGETPADYDKHFILTADIDLDPNLPGRKVFDRAVIAPDTEPAFGFQGTTFTGVFDGNGHTISRLTIIGDSYLGLFGRLESGEVRNLGLVNVNITGSGYSVGGLIGSNYGPVVNCYSTGTVSGTYNVGGLVGWNFRGTITQCHSTCTVTGSSGPTGGLVGMNGSDPKRYSFVFAGQIFCCYATGEVKGNDFVGGLVGWNDAGHIADCYATGPVTGGAGVAGLVGKNGRIADVTHCYSTGAVMGNSEVGGLVGFSYPDDVTACFWDTQTSGQATSTGGTGKTTAEMQNPKTFMASEWDFVGQPDGPSDIWAVPEGGGYPILWWQQSPLASLPGFSGGSGEPNDPYMISRPEELNSIGHNPRLMKCHFKLTHDINLAVVDFYTIGSYDYRYDGVFDGNGKTIRNLSRSLFGCIDGLLRDLTFADPNCTGSPVVNNWGTITGCSVQGGTVLGSGGLVSTNVGTVSHCYSTCAVSGDYAVGGLVGCNYVGTMTQCYSTGAVSGDGYVGGLVGWNYWGMVTYCYSTGAVNGTGYYVGGLVGHNYGGTVTQCYVTGPVSGNEDVGGLVGENIHGGTVTYCYSTGAVTGQRHVGGLVGDGSWAKTNGFWDIQTSGQATSDGGTGKTTAEMQTASIFLDAGWDFVGETVNGTEDLWWILEGKDYPRLSWEIHNN